jgi:methyltransferase-like protein
MDRYYKINEILLNCDKYLQRISDTKFKMAAVCRLENEASCLRERERENHVVILHTIHLATLTDLVNTQGYQDYTHDRVVYQV